MNARRALIAAALQIIATLAITAVIVTVYIAALSVQNKGSLAPERIDAIGSAVGHTAGITVGIIAAFFAGWWGARGLGAGAIKQGVLIGSIVAALGALIAAFGEGIGPGTAIVLLDIVAAAAGAAWAGRRTPAPST